MSIDGILLSAFVGLIGTLIVLYLRKISQQMTQQLSAQDARIKTVEDDLKEAASRKDKCRQDFVDKVDYIREVTKLEKLQTKQLEVLCELKGSMTVIEQMPKICGNIATQVVKQMQKETANNG